MSWLRRIMGVTRRDRIRNEVIYDKLGQNETTLYRIKKKRTR